MANKVTRVIFTYVVFFSLQNAITFADILNGLKSDSLRSQRDPSENQLTDYKTLNLVPAIARSSFGAPVGSETSSLTVGPNGPILLQDTTLLDVLAHFDRERIPERVVHAKGTGAFGYFEVTHDITRFTKATIFSKIGKRTDMAVRFSFVGGERGSADTMRDVRGFALKFYTEDGNWDLVGNNWPVFFIRDPILFSSLIHSQKRNPATNLRDADAFWDFVSNRPESTYQILLRYTDAGIPNGYRGLSGHGIHAFKLVNAKGEAFWCKFHYLPNQRTGNLTNAEAMEIAGRDQDYSTRDLNNAIRRGDFPSWTFYVQIMPFKHAFTYRFNPFDSTKDWPQSDYPYLPVGRFVLNKNPSNYFQEVEQIAFSPSHLIPGIEPSPDKLLHGRLFSYPDTQYHRLGANYLQLPVNCPYRVRVTNYERDGPQSYFGQDGAANYYPNSFRGPEPNPMYKISPFAVDGIADRYEETHESDYEQPRILWKQTLTEIERKRLVENIASSLQHASSSIQEKIHTTFSRVDHELSMKLRDALNILDANPFKSPSENL